MSKKKRKKRVLKFKNIFIILGVLIGGGVMFYYAINMPVENIYIVGNDFVSDNDILVLSGLDKYPSFLLTTNSSIKTKLLNNNYIEEVNVYKKVGNVIELEIKEYDVIAVNNDGELVLANGSFVDNNYGITDVPRLISNIDGSILKEFAYKFSRIDSDILREISEIEYSPVEVDADRFLLYMNDGNFVYITLTKIDKMNKYNDIKDELIGKKGIIYLDSGDYVEIKG